MSNKFPSKKAVTLVGVTALLSFSIVTYLVLVPTGAAFETRRQTLIMGLVLNQNPDGGFPTFSWLLPSNESNLISTADAILVLEQLNILDMIDAQAAVDYIVERQNQTTGSFIYGENSLELNHDAILVETLSIIGELDCINTTLLANAVLTHYNETSGAFYEPEGRCSFQMWLHSPYPYIHDNIISTYLGIQILKELDQLDKINVLKTIDWIADCKGNDGGFRPFPNASGYTAGDLGFITGFEGTGLPYTFSALQILYDLGYEDYQGLVNREQIIDFIWDCQSSLTDFAIIPCSDPWYGAPYDDREIWETLYAINTLYLLDAVSNEDSNITNVLINTLAKQQLGYQRHLYDLEWQWHKYESPFFLACTRDYGLFEGATYYLGSTFCAVQILAFADALSMLDTPSLRCLAAWRFVSEAVIWTLIAIIGGVIMIIRGLKNRTIGLAISFYFAILFFTLYILYWL